MTVGPVTALGCARPGLELLDQRLNLGKRIGDELPHPLLADSLLETAGETLPFLMAAHGSIVSGESRRSLALYVSDGFCDSEVVGQAAALRPALGQPDGARVGADDDVGLWFENARNLTLSCVRLTS